MNHYLRLPISLVALGLLLILLGAQFKHLRNNPSSFAPEDFVEYWAAGYLNERGENPYDPEKLLPLERSAGRDLHHAIFMFNPPWTLTLVMPLGLIDHRVAQVLWLLLGLALILVSADLLYRIYDGPAEKRWVAWLLAFTFMPTFFVLQAGQIGPWVLAGAVLFLYFLRQGWPMLAGAATVLLLIKPHLAYLFWIVLLVWGVRGRWKVLQGGAITGVVAALIPVFFNPDVWQQYRQAIQDMTPTSIWRTPTIGAAMRWIEGTDRIEQQLVPAALGLGWLIWHASVWKNESWDWNRQMPLVLLVSFVTAAYGSWPFDLVVLLPCAVQVAALTARKESAALRIMGWALWAALNLGALVMNLLEIDSFWYIWMAPTMLASYVFLMRQIDRA